MISLNTIKNWWNDFFYSSTEAHALSIFRLLLGFFLTLNAVALIPDIDLWFHPFNSLVSLQRSMGLYNSARINLFFWLAPSESVTYIIVFSYLISSISFMLGYKTRISALIAFVCLASMQNRMYSILNSGDTVMRCMLFPMLFAPSNRLYSIDSIIAKRSGESFSTIIPITTVRLLQLQFSLVYLATTLFKLKGYDWVDGTAVYYSSRLVSFQRVVIPYIFDYMFLIKFATWTALIIEGAMGSLVWIKEFKYPVLIAGLILHIGIEITMSIGFFEWIMMSAYLLFVDPAHIKIALEKVSFKFRNLLPQKS
jgi:hypothetical protein